MYNRKYYRQSFYLLLHLRQQQIETGQQGYGMLLVSVLSIFMFSMLAACLTMTNLSTSVTRAYTDEQNAFYVAESGLNERASSIREKFIGYAKPTGYSPGQTSAVLLNASVLPESMRDCSNSLPTAIGSGDFSCQHTPFTSNTFKTNLTSQGTGANTVTQASVSTTYFAHTFVADQTCYVDTSLPLAGQSCSADPTNKAPRPQIIPAGQLYTGLNSQDYHYTIFSTASEDHLAENMPQTQVTLQMNFTSRAIPLFQFGAFSNGDLEISSHSDMNVYGRVHANKNLLIQAYTNSGDPTPTTEIFDGGNITTAGNFYTQNPANSGGATPGNNYIVMSGGNVTLPDGRLAKLIPADHETPFTATELQPFAPKISNGAMGVKSLTTPGLGFLRTRDAAGNIGDYYGKADIRLVMQFDRSVPFDLSTIQTGTNAKGGTCGTTWDIPSNRNSLSTAKCNKFTTGQLRSLQQPVLVLTSIANQTEETNRFCPSLVAPAPAVQALAVSDRERVLRALQIAIAADPGIISIGSVTGSGNLTATQQGVFKTRLDKLMISGLNSTTISQLTPASIASARSSCFLPAPIQKLTNFFNRQENRAMKLLQTNIQSLTIWNRDGRYVDFTGTTTAPGTATNLDAATSDATAATYATDGLLFERDGADSTAPVGSFQHLGLAAKDPTEGGLVFHSTVDDTAYPIDTDNNRIYNNTAADKGKHQSPFGFAFNGGANLPAPLTLASDQGIYLQGDYNSYGYTENLGVITNAGAKQPASVLGDTITVLSNQCLDASRQLNCGVAAAAALPIVTAQTEVHAAFATNQDSSCGDPSFTISGAYCTDRLNQYNNRTGSSNSIYFGGGLQNYIRMLESWTNQKFLYRGSMIKLNTPLEYNGPYITGTAANYYDIPIRDFGYDTDFNNFDRLPPLTPRVLTLVQEVFKRQH
jgi:Tfp pilus assembly protein PilX